MLEWLLNILGWNVRGLNDPDRRDTVHETIASSSCQIVCLQETKLSSVSSFDAVYIGGNRLRGYAERPANGTRGGILLLWDDSLMQLSDVQLSEFCLSAKIHFLNSNGENDFKITTVYGPTASSRKDDFFAELIEHKPLNGWGKLRKALQRDSSGNPDAWVKCANSRAHGQEKRGPNND
uniref:Uncharacterized protein n=1 Tax=Avena sativa TaxID=4498 RepID=A0ACD6AT57_AVESA